MTSPNNTFNFIKSLNDETDRTRLPGFYYYPISESEEQVIFGIGRERDKQIINKGWEMGDNFDLSKYSAQLYTTTRKFRFDRTKPLPPSVVATTMDEFYQMIVQKIIIEYFKSVNNDNEIYQLVEKMIGDRDINLGSEYTNIQIVQFIGDTIKELIADLSKTKVEALKKVSKVLL